MTFSIDESAMVAIEARRASGVALADALDDHVEAFSSAEGATLISPSGEATRDSMAAALRLLAQLTTGGERSIAVLGGFDSAPAEALEEHDYIGRLVVRLNVGQLIAVGDAARHIQAAAGLEGSWDGESVIVATPAEAYDLLRGQLRQNDVVLVMASERVGLGDLAKRLAGVTQ